ncbi:MAG: carbohydrate binding domain-containing protein [Phycisphaeraceae bacterium]
MIRRRRTSRRRSRERGGVYLAVLGASMLVAILGVAGLLAVRLQRRAAEGPPAATAARLLARSGLELAVQQIESDPDWRTRFPDGQWTQPVMLGEGQVRYRLTDVGRNRLSSDPAKDAWLTAEGRLGDAVRLVRVRLQPRWRLAGSNRLTNPGFERGRWMWTRRGHARRIEITFDPVRSGEAALVIRGDPLRGGGARQDVATRITSGERWEIEAWVRRPGSGKSHANLELVIVSGGTARRLGVRTVEVDEKWTRLRATVRPAWTGSLDAAHLLVHSDAGDLLVDDVVLRPASDRHAMEPAPESLEQVVLPWKPWMRPARPR